MCGKCSPIDCDPVVICWPIIGIDLLHTFHTNSTPVSHQVAESTEGYNGTDVFLVAKEAAMRPLR